MTGGIERRYYQSVNLSSSLNDDYVIPADMILDLRQVGGNASALNTTEVAIIWDPTGTNEYLLTTHGDANQEISRSLTGDGSKVLRIRLTNDQLTGDRMGGFWKGVLLNA